MCIVTLGDLYLLWHGVRLNTENAVYLFCTFGTQAHDDAYVESDRFYFNDLQRLAYVLIT